MGSSELTPRELLGQASRYLEEGWTRGLLEDSTGNVCAMGALSKASSGSALYAEGNAFHEALGALRQETGISVMRFNDESRTVYRVLAAFERATRRFLPTLKERLEIAQAKRRQQLTIGTVDVERGAHEEELCLH